MVSLDEVRTVVGIMGNVVAFILFLSPLPTFIRIWKKGSVEEFSPVIYLATLVNCMVWILYGLPIVHPDRIPVLTINGSGMFIELVFLIIFIIYADNKNRLKVVIVIILELIFIAVVATLVLTLAHSYNKRSMVAGILCIVFNVMMYAAPLAIMKSVIRTKSVEYMPFFVSLASFANGVCWTAYGCIGTLDPYMITPNGLGTLLGLAQLILYFTYYKPTPSKMEQRKGPSSLLEVVVVNGGKSSGKVESSQSSSTVHSDHAASDQIQKI